MAELLQIISVVSSSAEAYNIKKVLYTTYAILLRQIVPPKDSYLSNNIRSGDAFTLGIQAVTGKPSNRGSCSAGGCFSGVGKVIEFEGCCEGNGY